jgi:hypothetical protein
VSRLRTIVVRMRETTLTVRAEATALMSWWMHELRDCAEALLARIAPGLARPLVVQFDGDAPVVANAAGELTPLALPEGPPHHRIARATVVLAEREALVHELVFPAAVERDLDSVVDLQLERELPLRREQVCLHSQILRRDREHNRITVRIIAVHRQRIEEVQRRTVEHGLRPVRIGVALHSGEVCGNLLPRRARADQLRVTQLDRRLATAASALAFVTGAVIAGQWIYERAQVNKELVRVQMLARAADLAARELGRQSRSGTSLIAVMERADALDVLSALTTSVPTDSWAYELEVAPGQNGVLQVKLDGFAPIAGTLVTVLEKTPGIDHVRLVSAASAGIGTGKDRLKLTARWAGK